MMKDEPLNPETRRRLLEAAGEIFSERGFRSATVREICARAEANVAAVNYHFGDKERLYSETLRFYFGQAMEKYPPTLGTTPESSVDDRLAAFIRSFLLRILDSGKSSWFGKLIAREMADPTPALDERVRENMQPMRDRLLGIVREIIGPRASETQLRHAAASIVGQIVFYHVCRPALDRMFPGVSYDMAEIESLAKHITQFCLAGLRELKATSGGGDLRPS